MCHWLMDRGEGTGCTGTRMAGHSRKCSNLNVCTLVIISHHPASHISHLLIESPFCISLPRFPWLQLRNRLASGCSLPQWDGDAHGPTYPGQPSSRKRSSVRTRSSATPAAEGMLLSSLEQLDAALTALGLAQAVGAVRQGRRQGSGTAAARPAGQQGTSGERKQKHRGGASSGRTGKREGGEDGGAEEDAPPQPAVKRRRLKRLADASPPQQQQQQAGRKKKGGKKKRSAQPAALVNFGRRRHLLRGRVAGHMMGAAGKGR